MTQNKYLICLKIERMFGVGPKPIATREHNDR